ncbi:uncharacterized protein LOC120782441 [Bactrocera tryoni]|uniref:uncharacterized protein LOC120782441 n=1 Tax=Bactrocera tryoni TaxID=59916 RepID=UPI001A97771B|nr:uncharacterized protein LOC120782441 [Bactrocera tryoni]
MLQIIALLLTTLPYIYGQSAERMEADNRVYIGDFTQPPYSMGKADNRIAYPYHNNYLSFPPNNDNGYQPFNPHSGPTTMPNQQTPTLGGYGGWNGHFNYAPFNALQGYNNFGITRSIAVGMSSNANFVPVTHSTHQPIMDGLHTSIGAALGGSMNGMSTYPANGHYKGYYPYNSLGILQSYM